MICVIAAHFALRRSGAPRRLARAPCSSAQRLGQIQRPQKCRGTRECMTTLTLDELSSLSLNELELRIDSLARTERLTTAELILTLAALHRLRMDEALGFSLWTYCHERLRMPESTATRYSRSAALLVRFPAAVDYLRDGRLSATTLRMLEKVLTPA